jgi:hypothetical protein
MTKLAFSMVTAAAFAALLASAPVNAAENYGPSKQGNQCFHPSIGAGKDLSFGTWSACPQPAAATSNAPGNNNTTSGRRRGRAASR